MPFNLGFGEVLVVLVVALLVFGGRLPQVGRSLGQGLTEFKRGIKGQARRAALPGESPEPSADAGEESEPEAVPDEEEEPTPPPPPPADPSP